MDDPLTRTEGEGRSPIAAGRVARALLPSALARQTRFVRLAGTIPALLAHPDWTTARPTVIWLHGRTVNKELDNGRYLRWLRAGLATCAIDLPGHGERLDPVMHSAGSTVELVSRGVAEVDAIVGALGAAEFAGVFDGSRLALGGMSAGGMVTLRRLCDAHTFKCAVVEGTGGNLELLYSGMARPEGERLPRVHAPERVAPIDPMQHLGDWRPIPLHAMHSEGDQLVPAACIRSFIDALRGRYASLGVPTMPAELRTWPETGAPLEHNGFGRVAAEAKTLQLAFLQQHL